MKGNQRSPYMLALKAVAIVILVALFAGLIFGKRPANYDQLTTQFGNLLREGMTSVQRDMIDTGCDQTESKKEARQ